MYSYSLQSGWVMIAVAHSYTGTCNYVDTAPHVARIRGHHLLHSVCEMCGNISRVATIRDAGRFRENTVSII